MKKRSKLLQKVLCTLLSASMLLPYAPAYAADEDAEEPDVSVEAEAVTEVVAEEELLTNVNWPEAPADWYKDYDYDLEAGAGDTAADIIRIKSSKGTLTEPLVVIPATATVEGVNYHTVLDSANNGHDPQVEEGVHNTGLWDADKDTITGICIQEGVKGAADCSYLFAKLNKLTTVDLSGFDTSQVTSLEDLFLEDFKLETADLSMLDTSSVTNMRGLFQDCFELKSVNINGLDASKVTDTGRMFDDCHKLESIDLSTFRTGDLIYCEGMFNSCYKIKTLDVSGLKTANVVNMKEMFQVCQELESISFGENFRTGSATSMFCMFYLCKSLKSLDLSGFDTSNVKYMDSMFSECEALSSLDVSNFTIRSDCNLSAMFYKTPALSILDLRSFDLENNTQGPSMFKNCGMVNLYLSKKAMKDYSFGSYYDEGLFKLTDIYYAGTEEEWTATGNTVPASVTMHYEYSGAVKPIDPTPTESSWYEDYAYELKDYPAQDLYELYIYAYRPKDKDKIPDSIIVPALTLTNGHYYKTVVDYDHTKLEYCETHGEYEASKEGLWHAGKRMITSISFDEGCIIGSNCERLFSNMINLQKVDLSKAKAPAVSSTRAMFYNCPMMKEIKFGSEFNCSNVVNAQCMFYYCRDLKSLDVSMLDTSSVENMWSMFGSCRSLTELNIGGKFSTVSAKDMSELFTSCESLKSIDLTNIKTSNATTVGSMFAHCESLESVDISGFKFSSCTSLITMFSNCKSLKKITFGNINTSGILSMENMFENCYSLRSLDLRSFDFSGLNGAESKCRYDNFLRGSGVVNLYLPVAAPAGVDLTQEATYGPPELHMATTAENLKTIYYSGTEEEWEALGNKAAADVEIVCGYEGAEKEVTGTYYVSEIKLSDSQLELAAGKTAQLTVSIIPSDATDKSVSWSVKDTKIASVDANGLVTAKSKGSTEIVATAKGAAKGKTVTASCLLYVSGGGEEPGPGPSEVPGSDEPTDPQPEISADTTELKLVVGQKFNVGKGWSSNSKILSVNKKSGAAKAKKEGTATLTHEDGAHSITATIVKPALKQKTTLEAGNTEQLTVDNSEDLAVLWSSSAPDIASVNETGLVTAVAKGSAKITAWINGSAYKCTVKVTETTPSLQRTLHLNIGASKSVSIKGLSKPDWQLAEGSEEGIVEIIKGKKIKGKAAGTVTLVSGDYKVDVTVEDPSIVGADAKKPYKLTMDGLTAGDTRSLKLTAVSQDVVFKSNKSNVAFISAEPDADGNYTITARGKGTAKITTKVNGKSLMITVKVK